MHLKKSSLFFLTIFALGGVVFEGIADGQILSLPQAKKEILVLKARNLALRTKLQTEEQKNAPRGSKRKRHKNRNKACAEETETLAETISELRIRLNRCKSHLQACNCAANPSSAQCSTSA